MVQIAFFNNSPGFKCMDVVNSTQITVTSGYGRRGGVSTPREQQERRPIMQSGRLRKSKEKKRKEKAKLLRVVK